MIRRFVLSLLLVLAFAAGLAAPRLPLVFSAQTESRYFPETHHTVQGLFLRYWNEHGALAQQGYPLTEEFSEASQTDVGAVYTVQYFERAIFERHPEHAGTPFEVLLTQLGKYQIDARYPNNSQPAAAPVAAPGGAPVSGPPPAVTLPPAPPPPTATAPPTARPPTPYPTSAPTGQRCGAVCRDGTTSGATGSGACSHHGGVDHWIYCP